MRESLRQRWPEIRALLEAAVAQPRAERARFVDTHAADPALAAAVHELLAAEDPATLAETPAAALVDLRGARLGPFRLDCRIGAGGMGEVWRAERVEGGIAQTVAIKLLHAGLDQGEGGRRFAQERQLLAELDHPSIARLIDGGLSPDGRLWYAMELVDGDSITAYAERHALTVRARVQLLVEVAEAVAAAHARGVIHRDLKPSNLLIDGRGRPRLLDFGIAKRLEPSAQSTATAWQAFTPTHAAPEQIAGETIERATDVWALGVIAYELLTGRLPFDRAQTPLAALSERVRSETATAPSRRQPQPRAGERIDAGLDRIVLQCLNPRPGDRYLDAAALADDLQRWLDGLPVQARGLSLRYRLGRRLRRLRPWALPALLLLLALLWLAAPPAPVGAVIDDPAQLPAADQARWAAIQSLQTPGTDAAYAQTRAALAALIEAQPDFLPAYLELADVIARLSLINAIDRAEALREVRRLSGLAMARHAEAFESRALLARLGYLEAEYEFNPSKMLAALRSHEALLRERPEQLGLWQIAMQAAGSLGMPARVLELARGADAVRADGRTAVIELRALADLGRLDAAAAAQSRAIALLPGRSDAYAYLYAAYARLGHWREALAQIALCEANGADRCERLRSNLRLLLRVDAPPASAPAEGSLDAALAGGGFRAGLDWVEAAQREGRDLWAQSWGALATQALAEGDHAGLLAVLQRQVPGIVDGDPPGPHVSWLALMVGYAHQRLGETERARGDFERALAAAERLPEATRAQSPQLPDVLALAWLGRSDEALARLRRYLDLGWSSERVLMETPCRYACVNGRVRPDPLLAPLLDLPAFQQAMAEVRARNAATLAALRREGLLPPG